MATPPTYVTSYTVLPGNTTSPKNTGAVINASAGDVICGTPIMWSDSGSGAGADNHTITSSPSETWTEGTETTGAANNDVWMQPTWAVLSGSWSGGTITDTRVAGNASNNYGFIWGHFTGTEGVGAQATLSGNGVSAPQVTITTQYANSAIFYIIANWTDDGNAARTHVTPSGGSTPVEAGHFNNSNDGSCTWGYVADAGTAGAKVVGLSAPTGQDSLMVAIEIRGSSTPAGPPFDNGSFDADSFFTGVVTKSYSNTWNTNALVPLSIVGTTNTGDAVSVTSRAPAVPTGAQAGDHAYVFLDLWNGNPTVTPPAGFNLVFSVSGGTGVVIKCYEKELSAADTGTYNFTFSNSNWSNASCTVVRGVKAGTTIGSNYNTAFATSTNFPSVSVNPSYTPALLWHGYNDSAGTHTPPTNFTETADVDCATDAYYFPTSGTSFTVSGATVSVSSAIASTVIAPEPSITSSLTPVTKTSASTWNVNSQVTKTYATTANVRSVVSKTYAGTWNVRTLASKSYAGTWGVNASISKPYASTWNVRAFAIKSYANTWNVATQVSKATAIDWAVRSLASKTYAGTWNIKVQVTNSYAQTWNVAADSPLTQVSKTYSSTWNVASVVSRTYDSTWNDNSTVSKIYAQIWNISQSIIKTYASTWNVAGAPVDTISIYDAIEATAPTNAASDDAAVNLGTEFYVTSQAWVTALRWYQPVGNSPSSSNRTLGIFRVDSASTGTLVAGPVTSTPSGSGWQTVDLETPYELTANQRYRVVVLHPNGRYGSTSFTFNGGSNLVQDFITAPNTTNATGNDNGSYFYGSSLAFTTDSFNSTYYWSDALITATNPSSTSTVTKTAPITWNTNSDLVASYFPSDIGSPWSVGPSYTDPDTNAKFGISFAVSSSCEIGGARWYSPVAKSGVAVTLNDYDSLTVYKTQQNYDVVAGWNELLFDEPFVASPGTTYALGVWQPGPVKYTYTDSDLWGGTVSHGSVYTTHTSATRYRYNSAFDAPIGSGAGGSSSRWAGMDVIELVPVEGTFDPTFGSTVALENAKDGTPSSNWMITGAGDTTNIGFTENFHYNKGTDSAINFKCHGTGTKLSIYRVGYYQGHGARKVAELTNTATTQGSATTISSSEGSIEFNWTTTATWTLPSDVMSGLYFAYYHNTAETNGSWIPFVIEDKARDADVVLKTADFTWYGAYNYCGDLGSILTGKSLYGSGGPLGSISTRHFIGSYHRPCVTREGVPQTYWRNAESPLIMFLEEQGIDVKYTSSIGLDQDRSGIDGKASTLICQGHDEYWSDGMWDNATYLRDHGTNLVFMSGNENFWRVFWDHTNKRMTCRKDTMAGPGSHVAGTPFIDAANWTGTWRDTRWTNRKPENTLTGTWFDMNGVVDKTHVVNAATYGSHVAWRNTTVATGTNLSLPRVVGFEADSYMPTQPSGSYSLITAETFNIDGGKADVNGETYAELGSFAWGIVAQRYPTSLVVGFGTCQWSWGLIGVHDRTNTTANVNARQMTLNLLADLGALPTTTASGLTTPTPVSLDNYGAVPLTSVTKSSSSTWNIASVVTSTKATNWNTSQQVTQTSAQTWNVAGSLFTVNKTSTSTWNINAVITPKTASFTWIVNTLVSKSYAPTWNVNNVVSKTYNLTWNDRQAVSTSNATSWNILSGVTAKTYANTWNLKQSINKIYAVAWNARTAVTKAYAQLWNTLAIGSVSTAYQVNWNVIAKVSSGNSQLWNVRTALVKSYAQVWAVKQAVLKSYANAWNLRAITAKSAQFSWNVFQVASNQTNFNWEVYSLVSKNTLSSWSVRARVIKEYESQWVVRQVVNNEIDFEWDIFIIAARQYSSSWVVSGGVIKQYNTTWNVNEDNKWYIKEPDGTFTLLRIAGIWNGTQVVPV